MKPSCFIPVIVSSMLAGMLPNPAQGATLILADDYNVTGTGSGFALNTGVNSGINPPTTRLTGTAAGNLRYIKPAGTKADSAHTITSNKLAVARGADSSTLALSAGTGAYDFSGVLGTLGASPAEPAVYEITVRVANTAAGSQRCSFAISTTAGTANSWSFGVQLYRASATTDTFYTIQKRVSLGSSGQPAVVNLPITTTAPGSWGSEIPFLIRVTDAGAETSTFSSRVQVSLDGGASWIYDTSTDTTDLPNGWRFDGAGRYFLWDVAGSAGPVTYDDFSVTWISGPEPKPRTWTGGGSDNYWSTGGNWGGTTPITGDPLIFAGSGRPVNTNDLVGYVTPSVSFLDGGFELYGNPVVLSAALTNLAGNNTVGLDLSWATASAKSWHLAAGSQLTLRGLTAIDVTGNHTFYGGGTLWIAGPFQVGSQVSSANPPMVLNEGRIVLDGASFTSVGGYRMGSAAGTTTVVETVLTNHANFYLSLPAGGFRVGDSANGVTNRLIVYESTLTMSGGDMGVPWAAGATGEVIQVGGTVAGCDLNFNHAGAGVGIYRVKNGVLEPRQIARNTAGGSCALYFDNAILRTYLTVNNPFLAGLDVVEIGSGGLRLETSTADVVIEQPLSGPGGLVKGGSYGAVLSGANTYAGNTVVEAGRLVLPTLQTNGAGIQVADFAELGVSLRGVGTTLEAASLSLGNSAVLSFDLGSFANPVTPLMRVGNLTANAGVSVKLSAGLGLAVGQFVLVDYSGGIGGAGFGAFTLDGVPAGVSATLVNNVANSSIDLLVTAVPGYRWTGAVSSSWDTWTENWLNLATGLASAYSDGFHTEFLDGAVRGLVEPSYAAPARVVVSNTVMPYVFSGGSITTPLVRKAGTGSLTRVDGGADVVGELELNEGAYVSSNSYDATFASVLSDASAGLGTFGKQGPGTLTITSTNSSYDGAIVIEHGVLKVGAEGALGSTNGTVTILPGATLDVNDIQSPQKPVIVSGAGFNGQGAITESSGVAGVQHNLTDVTLVGDTTFGCAPNGRWDIRVRTGSGIGPGLRGNGYKLTKVGGGTVSIACQRHFGTSTPYWDMNLGDVLIAEGTLTFAESLSPGNPTNSITIAPGAILNTYDLNVTNPIVRGIFMTDAQISSGGTAGDTNVYTGTIHLTGAGHFRVNSGTRLFINGPIVGSGAVNYSDAGAGMLVLNATNTYSGDTTVTNGTLAGGASIAGNLVMLGGTLAPGEGVGVFKVGGDATLGGTTRMELAPGQTQNSDRLDVGGNLVLGGALEVVLAPGAANPVAGEVFQLFGKAGAGSFTSVSLPDLSALPGGLSWNTNDLYVTGAISVVASAAPSIGAVALSGTDFIFSGTGGVEGATYYVLRSTNVAAPSSHWTPVATNVFGPGGVFSYTNAITPAVPESFFRLQIP